MESNIQLFKNEKFGEVRVAEIEGKTYFVGSDVAKVLGYVKPQNAITQHCKHDLKRGIVCKSGSYIDANGEKRQAEQIVEMLVVPESDIYRLVVNSQLPQADQFESWIFDEVLPAIRKHGGYMASHSDDTEESIMARALIIAQATIERSKMQLQQANSTIMEQAPKVECYDKCLESKGYLTVNMIAAELGISSIKLNKLLCEWGVQYKQTDCYFLYSEYRNDILYTARTRIPTVWG
ncbi:MAG: phage antirepressor KilAC domain-containing protein [Cytophagaceae bacterium]|jgi:prophage antirepressor-like protein|nr:phage antirepressor KilAC domain-containing protein [Cytophagaceae bacterium]